MMEAVKGLLSSKKALATIVGMVGAAAAKFGLDPAVGDSIATLITALISAYVIGQGAADMGKEKAKIEAGK